MMAARPLSLRQAREPVDSVGCDLAAMKAECQKGTFNGGKPNQLGPCGREGALLSTHSRSLAGSLEQTPVDAGSRGVAGPQAGHCWPELMAVDAAAAYVGERNARAFRRRLGKVYPSPIRIPGRGDVWRKQDLDACIASLDGSRAAVLDAVNVL